MTPFLIYANCRLILTESKNYQASLQQKFFYTIQTKNNTNKLGHSRKTEK